MEAKEYQRGEAVRTALYYDEIYLLHDESHRAYVHPENPNRLKVALEYINNSDIKSLIHFEKPQKSTIEDISKVHDIYYIQEIYEFCKKGGGYLDPDTYAYEHSYDAAMMASGAIVSALENIRSSKYEASFCLVRPPGHHAEYSKAMGFCIFNNIAIGARKAQKFGYKKVYIADFDVHHPNGTQHTFYEDPTVFLFSTHAYPFYPGTGGADERGFKEGYGFTLNIPLRPGTADDVYIKVYQEQFVESFLAFKPDILLISAGYDLHQDDPLGPMNVSSDGIKEITSIILKAAKTLNIPAIATLEGGYNYQATAQGILDTLRNMVDA